MQQVLDTPSKALLFPRPRRFGKTLNLSTLRAFVEKRPEDFSHLFEGLAVWNDPGARAHFQRYPVVFLSFKDVKYATWPECLAAVGQLIATAVRQLDLAVTDEADRRDIEALHENRAAPSLMIDVLRGLFRAFGERPCKSAILGSNRAEKPPCERH